MMNLRELLKLSSNKSKYGIFNKETEDYYIVNEYNDENAHPGFFPCEDDKIGWIGGDLDSGDKAKPELKSSVIDALYEKYSFLDQKLWIEDSRHGYHFYIFIGEGFTLAKANYIGTLVARFINSYISNLDIDIIYPSLNNKGNSYFLKNTNEVIYEGSKILSLNEIPAEIIEESKARLKFEIERSSRKIGKLTNYHVPRCFEYFEQFYKKYGSTVYRHGNGHKLRIFYCNYLAYLGYTEDQILEKFKIFTDFNENKARYQIQSVLEKGYFPPNCRTLQYYMEYACNECKKEQFQDRIIEYNKLFKPGKYFFRKYTRAGFTTYIIRKCIEKKLKLLIIEPVHKIDEVFKTVEEQLGKSINTLHLRPNKDVCVIASKIHKETGLPAVPRLNCYRKCKHRDNCLYFEQLKNLENGQFDVVYATYHKFALMDLAQYNFDAVFFDEFSTSKNLIESKLINKIDKLFPIKAFSNIINELNRRLKLVWGMKHDTFINLPDFSMKQIRDILQYILYTTRALGQNPLADTFSLIKNSIYRYGNTYYSFNILSDFIDKLRRFPSEYIFATDTISPLFTDYCGLKQIELEDPLKTDQKFYFKEVFGRPDNVHVITKNKHESFDYFRSDKSRGISLEYNRPIYLSNSSFAPEQAYYSYLKFLIKKGIIKSDKIQETIKETQFKEAANEIYQSISRFKTPFSFDQSIHVYYQAYRGIGKLIKQIRSDFQ